MLVVWLQWPGRTPEAYQAWCASRCADREHDVLFHISGDLHQAGLVDMNTGTITRKGRALVCRLAESGFVAGSDTYPVGL